MTERRRSFSAEFKAKVALEALRGEKTINEIASEFGVHPNQVSKRQARLLESLPEVFANESDGGKKQAATNKERDELFRQIGRLNVEIGRQKKD